MENFSEINKQIAKNLACYRKAAGLTQAELAEKINYSDKSVSKWEQGNGVPDVCVLMQLARLYGVTLDELVGEDATEKIKKQRQRRLWYHVFIMLLSSGIIWLVATCIFVSLQMWLPTGAWWIVFIYAVAINAVVLIVYTSIWKYRLLRFVSVSAVVWTILTSVYLTVYVTVADSASFWLLFLLGIPLQVLEILWVFFRSLFSKNARKKRQERLQAIEEEAAFKEESENI